MGPGALSFLLLLLLVATGDADMKGHFDPGEETGRDHVVFVFLSDLFHLT